MNKHFENIKVLFSDIDGTLTNGQLFYDAKGESLKVFHVKDGAGIKLWMKQGLEFGVISARTSGIISNRMHELGVNHIILNSMDKKEALGSWLKERSLGWENLAYIGDDTNDLSVMQLAAISAAPADAVKKTINAAGYQCLNPGGMGAVREFIDFLLENIDPSLF